jgi:hypothetical protein
MAKAIMKPKRILADDLALVKEGWKLYEQADPEPVYFYLARVYGVVRAWPKADRARCAQEMLKLTNKQVSSNHAARGRSHTCRGFDVTLSPRVTSQTSLRSLPGGIFQSCMFARGRSVRRNSRSTGTAPRRSQKSM